MREIFEITLDNGKTFLATQSNIDFYEKYRKDLKIIKKESIGSPMPKDFKVSKTGQSSGNCYISAYYEITASEKLDQRDMEIIRLQYDFLSGQSHAKVNLDDFKVLDNGRISYEALSERDSSD